MFHMNPHNKTPAGSDDETLLFRNAVRDVKPIRETNKVIHSRKLPRPVIRKNTSVPDDLLISYSPISEMEPGDEHSFLRSGVSRKTIKQLRRGHWKKEDQLDLHGFTRDDALRELDAFLDICSMKGFRCVQVIHGKGLNSKNSEPVLKTMVWNRLKQHSHILAFCEAGPASGGSGAVLILFRSLSAKKKKS